jgi:pimeloyl-ACP methyl ester carboxylesterase
MTEKNVTLRGRRIVFREQGAGDPVVLVHGNTGCGLWYSRVMDLPGFRAVAPDLPNFGDSDGIDTVDIDVYADWLLYFLDALDIRDAAVVGHSLGGAVAMSLAVRHPGRVRRLMLVDSCPVNGLVTPEAHYPVIEMYRTNREMLKKGLQAVTPTLKDDALFLELLDKALRMNPEAFTGNPRALARFDYTGRTAAYEGPVHVVWGSRDVIINRQMAEATARAFPKGTLEMLEGVGHSVMVEDPPRFRALLLAFLKRP